MIIKLGPASTPASIAPASPGGLRLVLPALRLGGATAYSNGQNTDVLRAVAAAAAAAEPGRAKQFAKEATDEPGKAHDEYDENEARPVLLAVVVSRDSRSTDAPKEVALAVARRVGANPPLVAAAAKALTTDARITAALWWVATLDKELLARAGQAATRASLLKLPSPDSALDSVKEELADVRTALDKKIEGDALKAAMEDVAARLSRKIDADAMEELKTDLNARIDGIGERVTKLEGPAGGGRGSRY